MRSPFRFYIFNQNYRVSCFCTQIMYNFFKLYHNMFFLCSEKAPSGVVTVSNHRMKNKIGHLNI